MAGAGWSIIATLAFWAWAACSLFFILKAFPRYGVFMRRPALIWGGLSVLLAGVWMCALRYA